MQIKFSTDKVLNTKPIKTRLREGEKNSDLYEITGDRFIDQLDLSTLSWTVVGTFTDYDEYAEDSITFSAVGDDDETITFQWQPSELFTAHAGGISIWLEGSNSTQGVVCKIVGNTELKVTEAHRKYSSVVVSTIEKLIQSISYSVASATQAAADAVAAVAAFQGQVSQMNSDITSAKNTAESAVSSVGISGNNLTWSKGNGQTGTASIPQTTYDDATQSASGLMSSTDKTKLDGVAESANNYSHPTHTSYAKGLYSVTVDGLGHVTSAEDAPVATQSASGVMSSADKTKLDGVATGANHYIHPIYSTGGSSGFLKVTIDSNGHVSETTSVAKTDITALGIPAQDTTYSNATDTKAGLMSTTNKKKCDKIGLGIAGYTIISVQSVSCTGTIASATSGTCTGTMTAVDGATGYWMNVDSTSQYNVATSSPTRSDTTISVGAYNFSNASHTCSVKVTVFAYKSITASA